MPGMRAEEETNPGVPDLQYLHVPPVCELSSGQEYAHDIPFDDYEGYVSSSCSISMSSEIESSHLITVPVFVEPAPPELRPSPGEVDQLSELWRGEGGQARLQHQETLHTDSGLDTEEICPATPTGGRFRHPP